MKVNEHTEDRGRTPARRMAFTDLGLNRLKHPASGQIVYWDTRQPGLSVLISGRVKTFRATYRLGTRFVSTKIGRVGELPLGEARKKVAEHRVLGADGIDPRRPKASVLTFEGVVDRFIDLHAKSTQRRWQQTEAILKRNCAAWLKRPIAEIGKADARMLIRGFIADGHPHKAAVTKAWLRKLWRWAAGEDIVPAAIMDNLGITIVTKSRDRFYNDDEIKVIWCAADGLDPVKAAFFKLLILLAPRKSALAGMRWCDLKDNIWTTPFELTKSKASAPRREYKTPLPALAQRILSGLPRTHDRVFPSMPLNPMQRTAAAVRKVVPDFAYHTARHTLATHLQDAGHPQFEIALVLNHSFGGVTGGYSHGDSLELKLNLLTKWADHVQTLIQPSKDVTLLR